jgi:hypothetical protein
MTPLQSLVGKSLPAHRLAIAPLTFMPLRRLCSERATDPMTHEPNYAVNLELAELVNTKKANTSVACRRAWRRS